MSGFGGVKLHVVSGKGGTGKTTVAAALALALAGEGRTVLLTEVEGRQGIAQLFDTAPLPYEERRVATGAGGGEVYALAVDPEAALLEYLEMFYNLRRAGSALKKLGAIDFATTIAPGLRDVLLTGKVMEAATRERRGGGRLYDAVVLDAPPTGRVMIQVRRSGNLEGTPEPDRRGADRRRPEHACHPASYARSGQDTVERRCRQDQSRVLSVDVRVVTQHRWRMVEAYETNRAAVEDGDAGWQSSLLRATACQTRHCRTGRCTG